MPSPLQSMAEWARALRPEDIPADVLRVARAQHLSAAGAVRAEGGAPPEDAARVAGALALHEYDDFLLAGRTGLGAVPVAWSMAEGRSVDELLTATVVGNEIGGRVGLALLLGQRANRADTHVPAAAGAAAGAWLAGLDARGIAGAVAKAVQEGELLAPAEFAADPSRLGSAPATAALAAIRKPDGPPDLLDADSPFWGPRCAEPLHGAFGGLGNRWLTRTLTIKPFAAMAWAQVPLQAVAEILARHVKAAEKRLRLDQVERVELRVGLMPWAMDAAADPLDPLSPAGLTWSLKRGVAALIARHDLRPGDLAPAALADKRQDLLDVAARVEVVHDWSLTLQTLQRLTGSLGPLLGDVPLTRVHGVRNRLKEAGGWPAWRRQDLLPFVKARPDKVLRYLRSPPGDLGAVDLDAFRWHLPVEVKLYTSRGGWWPERRALPKGTVAGGDLEAVALAKHGGDAAAELLEDPGDADALWWVRELLA